MKLKRIVNEDCVFYVNPDHIHAMIVVNDEDGDPLTKIIIADGGE